MPSPWAFALIILAVYRVAHMLALEDGPFDLLSRWRELWAKRGWIGRGLGCVLCISFWLAMPAGWFLGPRDSWLWIVTWLAVAGGVLVLYRLDRYET